MSDAVYEHKYKKYLEATQQNLLQDYFDKTHTAAEVLQLAPGTAQVRYAGRVIGIRAMGKILFAHLYDFSGKIQICVRKIEGTGNIFDSFIEHVNTGDFIGVSGEMFVTKTGELTLRCETYSLLNKCLRTLPEKYHGIEDIESRYRQRYLDLIVNPESREVVLKRNAVTKSLRRFLEDHDYLEVETPTLQTQASGALARPFKTHHNALDLECSLRIAPETYLKRCIGAGIDRVFEFARCFRNEGISATHLQEFTMLEFYASYLNADKMQSFVAKMMRHLVTNIFQSPQIKIHDNDIDFSKPWITYDYSELILTDSGIDIRIENTSEKLLRALKLKGIAIDNADQLSWANLADDLYKKVTRPHLIQPCFLTKYPVGMAPLARRNSQDTNYVDMFQFVVAGVEIVKGYSELVDPIDQKARFQEQALAHQQGDEAALPMDEDYLIAMEHGFPPIAGVGIGIDRLLMMVCGCHNIKDTILFPLLRPQQHD